MTTFENDSDLIVFSSHSFGSKDVRTSLLMSEFALHKRVFFFEEPVVGMVKIPTYFINQDINQVYVIRPYLPDGISIYDQKEALLELMKEFITDEDIAHYTIWTDTPKRMSLIRKLNSEVIIYDCLKDYSSSNPELEQEVFQYADLVLTSGLSTYNHRENLQQTA